MARSSAGPDVDVNKASEEQLMQIAGVSAERAKLLVEHRNKTGPFHSWEDVHQIPGFGDTLVEKLKQAARLSEDEEAGGGEEAAAQEPDGGPAAAREKAEAREPAHEGTSESAAPEREAAEARDTISGPARIETAEHIEVEEGEEPEVDEAEIEALMALAQLDSEAAAAFETVAEMLTEASIQQQLREFASDHRRHVEDIGRLIADKGLEAALAAPAPDSSVFSMLASAIGLMGTRPAILALIGNEQFTNASYQTALDLVTDPDALAVLERNFDDEQRHIRWLTEQKERIPEEDEVTYAGS